MTKYGLFFTKVNFKDTLWRALMVAAHTAPLHFTVQYNSKNKTTFKTQSRHCPHVQYPLLPSSPPAAGSILQNTHCPGPESYCTQRAVHYTVMYCSALICTAVYFSAVYCIALHCTVVCMTLHFKTRLYTVRLNINNVFLLLYTVQKYNVL